MKLSMFLVLLLCIANSTAAFAAEGVPPLAFNLLFSDDQEDKSFVVTLERISTNFGGNQLSYYQSLPNPDLKAIKDKSSETISEVTSVTLKKNNSNYLLRKIKKQINLTKGNETLLESVLINQAGGTVRTLQYSGDYATDQLPSKDHIAIEYIKKEKRNLATDESFVLGLKLLLGINNDADIQQVMQSRYADSRLVLSAENKLVFECCGEKATKVLTFTTESGPALSSIEYLKNSRNVGGLIEFGYDDLGNLVMCKSQSIYYDVGETPKILNESIYKIKSFEVLDSESYRRAVNLIDGK